MCNNYSEGMYASFPDLKLRLQTKLTFLLIFSPLLLTFIILSISRLGRLLDKIRSTLKID